MNNHESKLPDFIIIGTMKGGTTILYDFINEHPDVTASKQKEIHYFSLYAHKGMEWYSSFFENDATFTGEASPTYFDMASSPAIPSLIKATLPEVKIILIVRDPVERAVSQFFHLQKINKIEALLEMDINEFFGGNFSSAITQTSPEDLYLYQTLNFSCYFRKLQAYLSVFGKERMLVLSNDQLKNDPSETMERVFNFLNLSDLKNHDFSRIKYSSGMTADALNDNIRERLNRFLNPDFSRFKQLAKQKLELDI